MSSLRGLLNYVTLYIHESPKCEDVGEGCRPLVFDISLENLTEFTLSPSSLHATFGWKEWYYPIKKGTDSFLVLLILLLPYYPFSSTSLSLLSCHLSLPSIACLSIANYFPTSVFNIGIFPLEIKYLYFYMVKVQWQLFSDNLRASFVNKYKTFF